MATYYSYKIDYAKTSRASCRTCKETIDKGELRIAALVQSQHDDGKDLLWYHIRCFSSERKSPLAVNEIDGFADLRWNDQDTLTENFGALTTGGGDATGSKTNGTESTLVDELSLLYVQSGSSKFPVCKEKILTGALAVSQENGSKEKLHHMPCSAYKREDVGFLGTMEGKKLPGFDALEAADQNEVKKRLPATEKDEAKKTESKGKVNGKDRTAERRDGSGTSNGSGGGEDGYNSPDDRTKVGCAAIGEKPQNCDAVKNERRVKSSGYTLCKYECGKIFKTHEEAGVHEKTACIKFLEFLNYDKHYSAAKSKYPVDKQVTYEKGARKSIPPVIGFLFTGKRRTGAAPIRVITNR